MDEHAGGEHISATLRDERQLVEEVVICLKHSKPFALFYHALPCMPREIKFYEFIPYLV